VISKSVRYLEVAHLFFVIYLFIQAFMFPESPRFNYSKNRFKEAREGLKAIAKMNSNNNFSADFKFDTEKELEDLENEGFDAKTVRRLDGGNEYGITMKQYVLNVILMSLLFSGFSFCFWLADFQAEYLGTDMYIIFYANGCICFVSGAINLLLYPKLGLKWLVVIVQSIAITSALFIVLIQERVISY